MPVLGDRIGEVLAHGELALDRGGDEPVLRYFEHEFPLRPGTEELPLEELARPAVRTGWPAGGSADEELNYRRFFDVDTLAALRVEDPAVFEATHARAARPGARRAVDGLRIDHPDGLADPRGYLRRLAEATGGAWSWSRRSWRATSSCPTLAVRRHDRLRRAAAGQRPVRRPGRRPRR